LKRTVYLSVLISLLVVFVLLSVWGLGMEKEPLPGEDAAGTVAVSTIPAGHYSDAIERKDDPAGAEGVQEEELQKPLYREPLYREALFLAVGDIMVHRTQFVRAHDPDSGRYDFSPSFEFISPYLQAADLAAGNLETTLAGENRGYSAYPRFNSPDEIAYDLRDAGFNLLSTANNHSMDSGEEGLYRTLDIIEDAGMKAFGTFRSREERDSPLIVDVNGINLAFLAYTYGTNMLPVPAGREYIVNLIDEELIRSDIQHARDDGADLVIVFMHWGVEYRSQPSEEQKELARVIASAGGDIIIGSHPHVIQPLEYITAERDDGSVHQTLVAYSLGNFISNQHRIDGVIPTDEVEYGLVLKLHLKKCLQSGEAAVHEVDCLLTWVHRGWKHRVLPLHEVLAGSPEKYNITPGDRERLARKQEVLHERLK